MRIAYMLTSLGIGGAEKQVLALAEEMVARGHEVAVIVLRSRVPREWQTNLLVVRLDMSKSPASMAGGLIRGRRFLRHFQPDILHSHTFPANMVARVLRALGAAGTVVSTIHNVYEGDSDRTLAYRFTDRFSRHTTAVSEKVADRYIKIGAVPRHKCSVVTNGIDARQFSAQIGPGSRAREFMFAEGDFVWLSAGRIVPAKDFDNLIAAFRRVRDERPNTQLWIAGELAGTRLVRINGQVVGTERYESEGIHWLGFCEDMAATIAPVDGFVLGSAWEGMPLVIGEAMAMEKPVVATDVGGVRELIGDAGAVVPPKNPKALADAMLLIMRTPEIERSEMGKTARARIVRHFDMNAKADEWESLYTRILSDR
jgi:glycosyltransferase involved in cell wall biosynthesis